MTNTLFVLLDGLEDHPSPLLGGLKPYEAADMPFLKRKASHRLNTSGRGYTHLFLNEFFTGHPPDSSRAALEAMGLGMSMDDPGRTAYRLSPAVISDGMIRWSYGSAKNRDRLIPTVRSHMDIVASYDPEIEFFIGGRAVLTMDCDEIPDLPAPPVDAPMVEVPGDLGRLVMSVADDLEGTTDYPWGCGRLGSLYGPVKGLGRMTAISNSPTSLGICATMGCDIKLINDLDDRFPAARKALDHGDVFLHVDEVDEYSHKKDPFMKKEVLEHTDRMMEEYFPDVENIVYFVDHGTSCVTGEHILTDVPLWTSIDTGLPEGAFVPLDRVVETLMEHR